MSSISETKIANFVNSKGPTVSEVSIFRNRNRKTDIRLNVDGGKAHLLDDPQFWSDGAVCRPWLTQSRYRACLNNGQVNHNRTKWSRDQRYRTMENWADLNPYNTLN